MGLTKQYRRFVPLSTFGVVASARSGVTAIDLKSKEILAGRAEDVLLWNFKTGEIIREYISGEHHEVTQIFADVQISKQVYVGYADGAVRIFDLKTGECLVTLNGHRTAVSTLALDASTSEGGFLRLASGGRDSEIVLWDVVNQCGLFKLKGHKAPITRLRFMKDENILVSSSKDSLIKFWDLDLRHCFATLTGHLNEVWDFGIVKKNKYLISGTNDSELRVWKLDFSDRIKKEDKENQISSPSSKKALLEGDEEEEQQNPEEDGNDESGLRIEKVGSILRSGTDKVSRIEISQDEPLIAVHGSDNLVESFLICSEDEVKKRVSKRAKKERKRKGKLGENVEEFSTTASTEATIQEEFRRLKAFKCGGKVRGVSFCINVSNPICENSEESEVSRIADFSVLCANNQLEKFRLNLDEKNAEAEKAKTLEHPGHRSDVRTVAFSNDNTAILSGSREAVKVWSRSAKACIRTIPSGYVLSGIFVPGDRQIVAGCKNGSVQIFDLASASVTEDIENAHEKEIWSLCPDFDDKGFLTASADKTVKFWRYELLRSTTYSDKQILSAVHERTLTLQEEALAVKVSNDGRLVAVSLMDSTVKVFFRDSLKFFLSLYGHKLPALCIDISSDSTLLVTGSADKNIKIWGLDFGDCHKSIFAHDDSVTAIKFIPNTHMFFTAGKDGKIKQWDADSFERILTLEGGHIGEAWNLSVSPNGKYVCSCGHDKTLRMWERSDEILVLDDERETEREKEEDQELATGDARAVPGHKDQETDLPTKKSAETERGAERLMEALQIYKDYQAELKETPKAPLPPLMMAYRAKDPDGYIATMIESVKSAEIEQTLMVLPFDVVCHLLEIVEKLLATRKGSVEIITRMFFFLVEIHYGPLAGAKALKPLLTRIRNLAEERLTEVKDLLGYNTAGLRYNLDLKDEREKAFEMMESVVKIKDKRRKKKQKEKSREITLMTV